MIRKPGAEWRRESAVFTNLRTAATGGVEAVRVAPHLACGLLCWGFATLWISRRWPAASSRTTCFWSSG